MADDPAVDDGQANRHWGTRLFNRAWEILDSGDSEPAAQRELLSATFGQRWHWFEVGGPKERAVADWQVAHALCRLGYGDLGAEFAKTALAEAEGWDEAPLWLRASCYEGMARACAANGDSDGRATWTARCTDALARLDDPEDRELISSQLASIP
ncbi:MAG: MerR family transcriptional regulator, thiopeptide resistance regulator [Frankiales bacterium]|nr:MerR family transcriptional regulator, thiopeptide resistance regulator [Frankiales bacterium]